MIGVWSVKLSHGPDLYHESARRSRRRCGGRRPRHCRYRHGRHCRQDRGCRDGAVSFVRMRKAAVGRPPPNALPPTAGTLPRKRKARGWRRLRDGGGACGSRRNQMMQPRRRRRWFRWLMGLDQRRSTEQAVAAFQGSIQMMPLSTRRSSTRGTPRGLFGSNGSITLHSKSVQR